jgi:hypothetical protein
MGNGDLATGRHLRLSVFKAFDTALNITVAIIFFFTNVFDNRAL